MCRHNDQLTIINAELLLSQICLKQLNYVISPFFIPLIPRNNESHYVLIRFAPPILLNLIVMPKICMCLYICASSLSHFQHFATPWPTRILCPWDSPGKDTGVGCHFFLHIYVYLHVLTNLRLSLLQLREICLYSVFINSVVHPQRYFKMSKKIKHMWFKIKTNFQFWNGTVILQILSHR